MGAIRNFLARFKAGDPVRLTANAQNLTRIANILEDIMGVGCRIEKPTNAEGRGWKIVVDGTSDTVPSASFKPPISSLAHTGLTDMPSATVSSHDARYWPDAAHVDPDGKNYHTSGNVQSTHFIVPELVDDDGLGGFWTAHAFRARGDQASDITVYGGANARISSETITDVENNYYRTMQARVDGDAAELSAYQVTGSATTQAKLRVQKDGEMHVFADEDKVILETADGLGASDTAFTGRIDFNDKDGNLITIVARNGFITSLVG